MTKVKVNEEASGGWPLTYDGPSSRALGKTQDTYDGPSSRALGQTQDTYDGPSSRALGQTQNGTYDGNSSRAFGKNTTAPPAELSSKSRIPDPSWDSRPDKGM